MLKSNVFLYVDLKNREEVLAYISKQAELLGYTDNPEKLLTAFLEREKEFSTGLQEGFAIPHAKTTAVKKTGIIYIRTNNPIKWETYDGLPVTDLFALLVPNDEANTSHLAMLSKLATALLEKKFKTKLRDLENEKQISTWLTKEIGGDGE